MISDMQAGLKRLEFCYDTTGTLLLIRDLHMGGNHCIVVFISFRVGWGASIVNCREHQNF
jgi:hypothetical protein